MNDDRSRARALLTLADRPADHSTLDHLHLCPADSLRRELEAALPIYHISRIWPLIEAALEACDVAARADERERTIAAIKASPFWDKHIEDGLQQMGYAQALDQVVQLLRSEPSVLAYPSAVSDGN